MYRLSKLPLEILYCIFDCLEFEDLVTLGRLNLWYSYKVSTTIAERVRQNIQKDGWRIHMDILATSHLPRKTNSSPYVSFSSDLAILSDFVRINPVTLTLEFKLYPLEENGMEYKEEIKEGELSLVIFDRVRTNISLVSYFAQVSIKEEENVKRLQQVNQSGSAMMNDERLWVQLNKTGEAIQGSAMMGTGCTVNYSVSNNITKQNGVVQDKIEKFKQEYERYKNDEHQLNVVLDNPGMIEFRNILISPDWWIKQMINPFDDCSSTYYEHAFW